MIKKYWVPFALFLCLVLGLGFLSVVSTIFSSDELQEQIGGSTSADESIEMPKFSKNDEQTYDGNSNVETLEFEDPNTQIYDITSEGTYVLSGKLRGSVHIDADDEIVHIILDNISIRSDAGPAIYVQSAGKVIITVKDETENELRDSTNYLNYADAKACVFSNSNLSVNGKGTLYVYGDYNDGIVTKGELRILNAVLFVRTKSDGIRGNDGVFASNSSVSVESEGSAIVSQNYKNEKGNVVIEGGFLHIVAGKYGVKSANGLRISDCEKDVYGVLSDYLEAETTY